MGYRVLKNVSMECTKGVGHRQFTACQEVPPLAKQTEPGLQGVVGEGGS